MLLNIPILYNMDIKQVCYILKIVTVANIPSIKSMNMNISTVIKIGYRHK